MKILSIIIISFNTADLIGNCIESIRLSRGCDYEIFIVDNASRDNSINIIKNYPEVHLIENHENRGFGAANNQAIPLTSGQYIYFLNPDTLIQTDTLKNMVSFMDGNPSIGLAGTRIINPDGSLQESISYRYPGQKYTRGELGQLKGTIACVLGASVIVRSDLIKSIKGFDESFFLYGEDEDLCLMIRKAGYEIGYIDSASIIHVGGQSERGKYSYAKWKKKAEAELIFYNKHYLPVTVNHIRKLQLIKAYWRIATLKITLPFASQKDEKRDKLCKYLAIRDVNKNIKL